MSDKGTSLPNANHVYLTDNSVRPLKTELGVYVWPNGWVTVYDGDGVNEGTIYPPHAINRIEFGKKK